MTKTLTLLETEQTVYDFLWTDMHVLSYLDCYFKFSGFGELKYNKRKSGRNTNYLKG